MNGIIVMPFDGHIIATALLAGSTLLEGRVQQMVRYMT